MTGLPVSRENFNRQSGRELQAQEMRAECQGAEIVLALGGGFSRGFAHLGVLDVLEQEHLPVSAIVGTSIGALLGAAYADGISVRDLCDLGRKFRMRDFLRFQRSQAGRDTQRKDCLSQFMEKWFGARLLEELAIPTSIVATDLDTGAAYVFSKGPLEVAIRASCAFPGLVKPVEYQGRLLGDGCIVAPVPTAIAASLHGGCVLGVRVDSNSAVSSTSNEVVTVFNSGIRTSQRTAQEPSWCRHADILLEPRVQHIDWNDFTQVDEAFAAGANAMRLALPAMLELLARRTRLTPAHGVSFPEERGLAL